MKAEYYADTYYQLPEKTLTIFSSGDKDFQFNDDHEILANGNLYDIVKTEIRDGKTFYYALSDLEEDSYVDQVAKLSKSSSGEKSLPAKSVDIHIGKYYEIIKHYPRACALLRVRETVKISNFLFQYTSPLKTVFSPPPDFLLS